MMCPKTNRNKQISMGTLWVGGAELKSLIFIKKEKAWPILEFNEKNNSNMMIRKHQYKS